jgi:hypothetical protein
MSFGWEGGDDMVGIDVINLGRLGGGGNVCRTSLLDNSSRVNNSPSKQMNR